MEKERTLIAGLHGDLEPVAELVEHHLAKEAMRSYETRQTPSGLLRSAWYHAEFALNKDTVDAEAIKESFATSQLLIPMIINRPDVHQDITLGAFTLATYLPLFRKRAENTAITEEDCVEVYRSLGAAMQYLRPLQTDAPPQWRMAEVGVLALSARMRQPWLLLYPASPREEASDYQRLNHDSYFYEDDSKVPLQQKLLPTQKVYDECISILTLQPLVDKGLRGTAALPSEEELSEKVNYLLSLIVSESAGKELTRSERQFLNFMSEAVAAHHYRLSGKGGVLAA